MTSNKGNNPELWEKLLQSLDEKLQLGLLEYLKRCTSFHFENDTLFLEAASSEDYKYLSKDAVRIQLQLLAQDSVKVNQIVIKEKV